MTSQMNIVVGIDFGTTNSLVSFIKDKSPRIVPNERGSRMTPSVVYFKEDGQVIVGELAKSQAVLNAERTITNVKLSMGTDRLYAIGDREYSPAEVSNFILKNLKQYAERYLGTEIRDVVITVPAYFNDRQREDTLKAAELAGMNVLRLLNEPAAAALIYGFSEKSASKLLVIDFGGGTLDITLMEYNDTIFRVRATGGSTSIGGTNFDQAIVDYIVTDFQNAYGIDLRTDRIAFQQLVIHAEKAKIDLSSTEETRIMIPYITVTSKGPLHLNMPISRTTLETLIAPILKDIEQHLQITFEQANLTPAWVETIILVGGSTRIPAVEELVKNFILSNNGGVSEDIQQQIRRNINPDEAVARGAGVLAGILEGSITNIEFHDIMPHDLGVEDDNGEFVTVLPRGTAYPMNASRLFTNTEDNQNEVCIHVLQKVGINDPKLVSLGMFYLKLNHEKKKEEASIDVSFAIDANGILNVSAIDLDSGEAEEITIEKVIQ